MPATYELRVVTPDQVVFSGAVASLVAPGAEGYLGVLAHHAPLLTSLGVGPAKITLPGGEVVHMAVSGGFLEVSREEVVILADAAEFAEAIDIERAGAAQERARERLQARPPDIDVDRARAALLRALTRLRVTQHVRQ